MWGSIDFQQKQRDGVQSLTGVPHRRRDLRRATRLQGRRVEANEAIVRVHWWSGRTQEQNRARNSKRAAEMSRHRSYPFVGCLQQERQNTEQTFCCGRHDKDKYPLGGAEG